MTLRNLILAALTLLPGALFARDLPLACESALANTFVTLAGPAVQIRTTSSVRTGAATKLSQQHQGLPSAWHLSFDQTEVNITVWEAACDTGTSKFSLAFAMLSNGSLIHGCCGVAE